MYKWSVNWKADGAIPAPNIIAIMIDMVLSPGTVDPAKAQMFKDATFQVRPPPPPPKK